MRRFVILFGLLILSFAGFSQIYSYTYYFKTSPPSACMYDVDNDGDLDLFMGYDSLVYYENQNGNFIKKSGAPMKDYSPEYNRVGLLKITDVDDDGVPELLFTNTFIWLSVIAADSVYYTELDPVSGAQWDNVQRINFTKFAISTKDFFGVNSPNIFFNCNFNNDGVPDVLYQDSYTPTLFLSDTANNQYVPYNDDIDYFENNAIYPIDWNNDNFDDILVYDRSKVKIGINDGTGNFDYSNLITGIGTSSYVNFVYPRDFNNDGRTDILIYNVELLIGFMNEDSSFTVDSLHFRRGLYYLNTVDLNNDGYLDIVGAYSDLFSSSHLYYFINQGNGNFSKDTINLDFEISDIFFADLDSNQINDVFVSGYGRIWRFEYENGSLQLKEDLFTHRTDFPTMPPYNPNDSWIEDFDNDGKGELLTRNDDGNLLIYDFQNEKMSKITDSTVSYYYTYDFNNDGLKDVIIYTNKKNAFVLINPGNFDTTWEEKFIISNYKPIRCGDLDRDGFNDFILLGTSSKFYYIRGQNDGTFTSPHFIAQIPNYYYGQLGDLTKDGKLDFVCSNTSTKDIFVCKFTYSGFVIDTINFGLAAVPGIYDFDHDGDGDIFAYTGSPFRFGWLENVDGHGNSFNLNMETLWTRLNYCQKVLVKDADGDGFYDVMFNHNEAFYLVHNNQNQNYTFLKANLILNSNYDKWNTGDINLDGNLDLVTNNEIYKLDVIDFIQDPEDQNICENSSAIFSVKTNKPISYQWQVSYNLGNSFFDLENDSVFSGVNTATLTIQNASLDLNSLVFRCKISQDEQEAYSEPALLIVNQDSIPPEINPFALTVYLDSSGQAQLNAGLLLSYVSDNCELDTVFAEKTNFDCSDLGTNQVLITAKDKSGNISQDYGTVYVKDEIYPIIQTRDTTLQISQATILEPSWFITSQWDNCGINNIILYPSTVYPYNEGDNLINITATDEAGNQTFATAILTVENTAEVGLPGDLSIYPNPVIDVLNIQFPQGMDKVEILSLEGKVLKQLDVKADKVSVDVTDLESGVYVLKITNTKESYLTKIIKK